MTQLTERLACWNARTRASLRCVGRFVRHAIRLRELDVSVYELDLVAHACPPSEVQRGSVLMSGCNSTAMTLQPVGGKMSRGSTKARTNVQVSVICLDAQPIYGLIDSVSPVIVELVELIEGCDINGARTVQPTLSQFVEHAFHPS